MTHAQSQTRRLAAIMFADIMGYTAIMQQDEERAMNLRDRHRKVMEDRVITHAGEIAQYYGDGALCLFSSAKEAVIAALEIQKELLIEPVVPHRIGIHLGDIVQDDSGVFGDGVNIASRIESLAIPGSVLLSDKVFVELENHPTIRTRSFGEFRLKNVRRPVGVYALDHGDIKVPEKGSITSDKAQQETKNIAVLPFTDLGSSEEGEYFAEGVSEEIIGGLSKVDGLSLICRTTCIAIKNSGEESLRIARGLNLTHLLEGSVRQAGKMVRVSVQLINTADGYNIWSGKYDGSMEDIFRLQEDIARHVVRSLRANFNLLEGSETILEQHTTSPEAHSLYLKGLHHWNRGNPESVEKALELFEEALSKDESYSPAQVAQSHCYAFLGSCGKMSPTDAYAKALNYAMNAIEANPRNAEAHLAIANIKFYHYWDWEATRKSLEKASSLGLNTGLMHQSYGLYHAAMGEHEEGIAKMQRALELDPLSIPVMVMLGTLYLFDEQCKRAISIFDEIIELEPSFRSAFLYKGISLACLERQKEALQWFTRYHEMVNHPKKGLNGIIIAQHALGNHAAVDEYLGRYYERLEEEGPSAVEIDLAIVHAGMGNYDESLKFLHSVYEKRFSIACMGMIWVIRCPYFKGLWQTEGFRKLMDRIGLLA